MGDKTDSLLSGIRQRCTRCGRIYVLDGRPVHGFQPFLEAASGMTLKALANELYINREMSGADIRRWLCERLGFTVSESMIYLFLDHSGVLRRSYAEHKKLSWKQGKMAGSMAKSRQTRKKTYLLGSKAEHQVRYLLCGALLALEVKWDVVIGDNLQHILERFEIDIPVVIVNRHSKLACRIAIEIDHSFTHSGAVRQERDRRKDTALQEGGWKVIRINGDHFHNKTRLAETVTDLAWMIEWIAAEALSGEVTQRIWF